MSKSEFKHRFGLLQKKTFGKQSMMLECVLKFCLKIHFEGKTDISGDKADSVLPSKQNPFYPQN